MRISISRKVTFTSFLISIFLLSSCSDDSKSLDDRYLDRVQTLDSTINSFYGAISSDNGKSFEWDLYRYVMYPEGKLIRYGPDGDADFKKYALTTYTADSYIEKYKKYSEAVGFYEKEIFRKVTTFGPISTVYSGYASFENGKEKPIIRGVNMFQLLNDGKRWWILNTVYTRETPEYPIPEEYLKSNLTISNNDID